MKKINNGVWEFMEKIKVIVNTDDFYVNDGSMKRSDIRKEITKELKENVNINELEFDNINYCNTIKFYAYKNNYSIVLVVLP